LIPKDETLMKQKSKKDRLIEQMIAMIQDLSGEAHRLAGKQVVNPELIRKA
jgi:hypothetical protein